MGMSGNESWDFVLNKLLSDLLNLLLILIFGVVTYMGFVYDNGFPSCFVTC